jgi:uncharacterized protein (UPF0548 family)
MFRLSRPTPADISKFISAQKDRKYSYTGVGMTRDGLASDYTVDHNRILLGEGEAAFERARRAVGDWKMFDMPWLKLCWPNTPIEAGANVAVLISHLGFWSLNASRIVYVIDEQGPVSRYGFAYGTLREHGEIGEERFTVEMEQGDQMVWYDLYAMSRPSALARLAYPYTRALQKRFARDSKEAMRKAVQEALTDAGMRY